MSRNRCAGTGAAIMNGQYIQTPNTWKIIAINAALFGTQPSTSRYASPAGANRGESVPIAISELVGYQWALSDATQLPPIY